MIIEGWTSLREKILGKLKKKWPIIVLATHSKQISEISNLISRATHKYGLGELHFEDAVKDAGVACEGLLRIICDIYKPNILKEKPEFGDLLNILKDLISSEFGDNVYQDLDFIRFWRNKVVHHPIEKPDELTTFQVIERAKIFNELFQKWIKKKK